MEYSAYGVEAVLTLETRASRRCASDGWSEERFALWKPSASWRIGAAYTFYVAMNKKKWDSLPPDMKKLITDVSAEYRDKWAVEWNMIDIEGGEFLKSQGGQIIMISDAESAKWATAAQPVIQDFKKDLVGKGYKEAEVDSWIAFVKERIEYWKGQEKAKKIPTAYQY